MMQQQSENSNNFSPAGGVRDQVQDAAMEESSKETMEEDDQKEGTLVNKYFEVSNKVGCAGALSLSPSLWSSKAYMRVIYSQLVDACRNNGAEEHLLHGTKAEFALWLINKQIPYPDNSDDKVEWSKTVKPLSPELIARLNSNNNNNNYNTNDNEQRADVNNNNNSHRKRQRQSVNYLENESSSESELNYDIVEDKSNRIRNDISEGVSSYNKINNSENNNNGNNNNNNNNNNIDDSYSKKHKKISGSGNNNSNNNNNSANSSSWYCYRCSFELKDGMLSCPYHGSIRKWNSITNQWISDIPNDSNSGNIGNNNQNWKIQPGAVSESVGLNHDNNINRNSSNYNDNTGNNQNSLRNGSNPTPLVSAPNNNGGAKCDSQINNTGNTYINNTYTDPQLTNLKSGCTVSTSTANHSLLNHTIVKRVLEGQFVPIENFKIISSNKVFQVDPESDLSGGTFSFDPVSGQFTKNPTRERAINTKKLTSIEEFCVAFLTGLIPIACGTNNEKISDYNSFLSECLHAINILNNVEVGIEYCEEIRRRHQQNNSNNINNNNYSNNNKLASLGGLDMNIFQIVSTRNMLKLIQHTGSSRTNYNNKNPQNEYVPKPCFRFNGPKGCQDEHCKFIHRCNEPECDLKHPRFSYHPLSYQKDKDKWAEINRSQSKPKKSVKTKGNSNVKDEAQE